MKTTKEKKNENQENNFADLVKLLRATLLFNSFYQNTYITAECSEFFQLLNLKPI